LSRENEMHFGRLVEILYFEEGGLQFLVIVVNFFYEFKWSNVNKPIKKSEEPEEIHYETKKKI